LSFYQIDCLTTTTTIFFSADDDAAAAIATTMIAADGPPKPTADWERIGERYYRKIQLYSHVFDEELELENYIIAGAPYSGALGTYRVVLGSVTY